MHTQMHKYREVKEAFQVQIVKDHQNIMLGEKARYPTKGMPSYVLHKTIKTYILWKFKKMKPIYEFFCNGGS